MQHYSVVPQPSSFLLTLLQVHQTYDLNTELEECMAVGAGVDWALRAVVDGGLGAEGAIG